MITNPSNTCQVCSGSDMKLAMQAPSLIRAAASAMEEVCCAVWQSVPTPPAEVSEAIAAAMIRAKNLRQAVENASSDYAMLRAPTDRPRLPDGEETID